MSFENCIKEIMEASGGVVSEKEARDLLDDVFAAASGKAKRGVDSSTAIKEEAARLGMELGQLQKIKQANAFRDTVKAMDRRSSYKAARDAGETLFYGLQARLTGMNREYLGNRMSVESLMRWKEREYLGGMVTELQRNGLYRAFTGKAHGDDIARELFELNRGPDGNSGRTKNVEALEVAKIIHKYQQKSMADMNREGAYIRDYNDYVTRTDHDADKIRGRGGKDKEALNRQKWVEFTLPHLDLDRTFDGDVDAARDALTGMWEKFAKGEHYSLDDVNEIAHGRGGSNLAKQLSASRVLHWKDADAFLAYQREYGVGDYREMVVAQLQRSARSVALMRHFGTNPSAQFEADKRWIAAQEGVTDRVKTRVAEQNLQARFDILTGAANVVANRVADHATRWLTTSQALSKLGGATVAALGDTPVTAESIGRQTNQAKAMEFYVRGPLAYLRGLGGISDSAFGTDIVRGSVGSARREIADSLLVGVDSIIGNMASRFDTLDDTRGVTARINGWYHQITGLSGVTDSVRMESQIMLSHSFGQDLDKNWADLGRNETLTMQSYGIGEKEWAALRTADRINPGGRGDLFEPGLAMRIPDDAMEPLLGNLKPTQTNLDRARNDLAMQIGSYLSDTSTQGVIEAGARERSLLLWGTKPGTTVGVLARLLTQFKAFPTALITRAWGRALNSGRGPGAAFTSSLHLAVGMTVLGYAALTLSDLLRGRDPRPWNEHTFMASVLKGGGLSVLGDIMLSDADKYGDEFTDILVGPSIEMMNDAFNVATALKRGDTEKAGVKAQQLVSKNLPFANIWYTRIFVEYAFLRAWQEAMNPGVLARREARDRREGITYWLPPTERASP